MTKTIIYCVIWPFIIFTGIFGNVLSLTVIRKTEDSNSTSKFLISLAVSDTTNLIVKGAQTVFTIGEMFWPQQYLSWKLSFHAFIVLSLLPDRISKGITVAIVCDRVVALTAPFRYKIICQPIRITAIVFMIYIVIASVTLPVIVDMFMFHFATGENRTIHTDIREQYRASLSTLRLMYSMVTFLLFDILPAPIVFVGNIIIIFSLRKRKILASTTSEVQRLAKLKERQLTKLLLTVSMLFFFLTGPWAVYRVLFMAGMTPSNTDTAVVIRDLHQTLSLSNSAINFVVYIAMNKKYREGFEAITRRCRQSNAIGDSHTN